MRKLVLIIGVTVAFGFTFLIPSLFMTDLRVLAQVPKCCHDRDDCNPGETCTGYHYACEKAGMNACEAGTTLNCGDVCDPNNDRCPSSCPCSYVGGSWLCHTTPPSPRSPRPPAPVVSCIPTAIGCIDVKSPEGFVGNVLTLAIGLAGGIAMLLIIFGGIQILTSAGNPDKIQAGKELITSAIAGLILIVFSVFILRIIGVEVLEIFK